MRPIHYENTISYFRRMDVDFEGIHEQVRRSLGHDGLARKREVMRFHPIARKLASCGVDARTATVGLEECQAMYAFWRAGRKVFNVALPLTHLLLSTDLKFQRRFLRLPFDAFFLSFEDAPIEIEWRDRRRLAGCYIYRLPDSTSQWRGLGEEGEKKLLVDFFSGRDDPAAWHDRDTLKLWFVSESVPGDAEGNSVSAWLCLEDFADDSVITDDALLEFYKSVAMDDLNDFKALIRLVLNTVLYINSFGADTALVESKGRKLAEKASRMPSERHRLRFLEKAGQHSFLDYIDVGRGVRLPREADRIEQVREGKTWSLSYRIQVRGHFKAVWKKTSNLAEDERRAVLAVDGDWSAYQRWVAPYTKGPELADVVNKEYHVG